MLRKEIKINLNYQTADNFLDDKLLINFILQETDKRIKNKNYYKFLRIKSSINKDWQEKAQKISTKVLKEVYEVTGLTL